MSVVLVLVNHVASLDPRQSTTELALGLLARGHDVGVVEATGLDVRVDGAMVAHVRRAPLAAPRRWVKAIRAAATAVLPLAECDCIWVRLSPGRDPRRGLQALVLQQLAQHAARGGLVLNAPAGLFAAASKLFITRFPSGTVPRTLVSGSAASVRDFVARLEGPAVLKPVDGTQGRDVFLVQGPGDPNLGAICTSLLRDGPIMAQGFVPGASEGDVRMMLLEGRLLEVDGRAAIVRRRPQRGEFRSNVHLGARPEAAELTPRLRELADAVGPLLRRQGLFLVGLDVVGDVIVECNVYAPGGFGDMVRLQGVDFIGPVLDAVEARMAPC